MTILSNISKNSGSLDNILIDDFFLLRETGELILREMGDVILLENTRNTNISKNNGTLSNINKNG